MFSNPQPWFKFVIAKWPQTSNQRHNSCDVLYVQILPFVQRKMFHSFSFIPIIYPPRWRALAKLLHDKFGCWNPSVLISLQSHEKSDRLVVKHTVPCNTITVTHSHERHGVWNHRSLECLTSSLLRQTAKRVPSEFHVIGHLWGEWPMDSPHKGPGARPTKHISIEFEIRWKFRTL